MPDAPAAAASPRGIGTLSVGALAALWGILVLGLILRTLGIGWGLPPTAPSVAASGFRGSYAFEEGEILDLLVNTGLEPQAGVIRFDPRRLGALGLGMTQLGLAAAQQLDFFDKPWRESYRQLEPGAFERIYLAGRLVSGITSLASVFLVFLLGREISNPAAGLWSSAMVAVAPGHVLLGNQISPDSTASALLMLAALLGVRLAKSSAPRLAPWVGLTAGVAAAASQAAVALACAISGAALWPHRKNVRAWMLTAGAFLGAVLLDELVRANYYGLAFVLHDSSAVERAGLAVLGNHIVNLARFSIGFPAAVIGAWGLWRLVRTDATTGRIFLAAVALGFLGLFLNGGLMMRDHLPLVPVLALAAGYGLSSLRPAARWPLGFLALAFGLAGSLAQIHFMLSTHPANLALAVLENSAAAGDRISRVSDNLPPLNAQVYPNGPNPLTDDLSAKPPDWVVTADLAITAIPERNTNFLADRYETIAIFHSERIFGWATFGESGSPPDWKYTHPVTTLYRLRR